MIFDLIRGQLTFANAVAEILAILVIIFLVLPFHEWAHAFTASKLGDTSIKYRGRLTLNPISHIDPMGALCLLLFNFGWAKPVPVDDRNFKNPKVGMAITAVAGPVANIIAGMAGALVLNALATFCYSWLFSTVGLYVYTFLSFYIQINAVLAVFNLIPVPPLDGSKILFAFLPDKWVYTIYQYQRYFFIAIFVLLWTGILSTPLAFLQSWLIRFIMWITNLPFGLF